jgi:hypothetical protein
VISVDTLPDDVLLVIFDYYVNDDTQHLTEREEAWQSLVHVCRWWRCIIFGSPRHLNLQLVCQEGTPARDMLDVWPALPLIIRCYDVHLTGVDNIIAVLRRSVRVCRIELMSVQSSDLEIFLAAMQQPFPELTHLSLCSYSTVAPVRVVPDSLLGGSAPRLQRLMLDHIPFPGLPKLLLSATHLVDLQLRNIPHSGYFSPEAMVTALSALTSLSSLTLEFRSPRPCPDQASRRPHPSTRSVLSILRYFRFRGITEYLEDLVAHIDAPRLNELSISFIKDIVSDTPRFMQFISRTPTLRALENAYITLRDCDANLRFLSQASAKCQR